MEWLLLLAAAMGLTLQNRQPNSGGVFNWFVPSYDPTLTPDYTQQPLQTYDPASDTSWFQNISIPFFTTAGTADMDISPAGLSLIRGEEGLRLTPYKDTAGYWTIGYGHKIVQGDPYHPYGAIKSISADQAETQFQSDVQNLAANYVRQYVTVPLTQSQFDALTSLVFNIGGSNFGTSTLLQKLQLQDYNGAAGQFGRWIYAGGKKDPVLINRRNREMQIFLGQVATA
jgi:lysozyme